MHTVVHETHKYKFIKQRNSQRQVATQNRSFENRSLICDLRSSHQENYWRSPHHQALFRHSQATLHLVNPMRVPIITTPSSGGLGRLNKQWLECWFKKNSYRPWSSRVFPDLYVAQGHLLDSWFIYWFLFLFWSTIAMQIHAP